MDDATYKARSSGAQQCCVSTPVQVCASWIWAVSKNLPKDFVEVLFRTGDVSNKECPSKFWIRNKYLSKAIDLTSS